ncbi:hypothetical protein [Aliikangiella coralliicola]|uniref:Uncharacterized protein n=1 Tax=Aliikangiella coralliicola TaxID=2592383 RepID=A0A545UFN2_9GAMM|nr:hypothetical protein [Aliikangiella coralliicola]TQV88255.1 hypothetical protein FLL46_06935 [Aliikangiella coralliicola]
MKKTILVFILGVVTALIVNNIFFNDSKGSEPKAHKSKSELAIKDKSDTVKEHHKQSENIEEKSVVEARKISSSLDNNDSGESQVEISGERLKYDGSKFEEETFGISVSEEDGIGINVRAIEGKSYQELNSLLDELSVKAGSDQGAIEHKVKHQDYFLANQSGSTGYEFNRVECGSDVCVAVFDNFDANHDWTQGIPDVFNPENGFEGGQGAFEWLPRHENDESPSLTYMFARGDKKDASMYTPITQSW